MSHSHGTVMDTTTSASSTDVMMVPYLHFAGGDHLFFQAWQPTSAGALAGACIGLIVLALFERWLSATRSVFDSHWRRRALALMHGHDQSIALRTKLDNRESGSSDKPLFDRNDIQGSSKEESGACRDQAGIIKFRTRTITPFIPSHDVPRGILYALQMLLVYGLMLAVMTFQASYIISIILGLSIGEIIFGRIASVGAATHH